MPVDPRTLREISEYAECHLIPACFEVSNITVSLDKDFDSKIGAFCDVQLEKWVRALVGNEIHGKASLVGGSKKLTATLDLMAGRLQIPKPRGGSIQEWESRALGVQGGQVQLEGIIGESVDVMAASVSLLNSAMLVLYHQGWNLLESRFDKARELLAAATEKRLKEPDFQAVCEMTWIGIVFDLRKAQGQVVRQEDLRRVYDQAFDPGDGVLDDFPKKCVSEAEGRLVVTLPYSRSLRGLVRFP